MKNVKLLGSIWINSLGTCSLDFLFWKKKMDFVVCAVLQRVEP